MAHLDTTYFRGIGALAICVIAACAGHIRDPKIITPQWPPQAESNLPNPTVASDRASSATLEETLAFLKAAMPTQSPGRHLFSEISTLDFSNGVMYWTAANNLERSRVALKDLDPTDVVTGSDEYGENGINVRCTNGQKIMVAIGFSPATTSIGYSNKRTFLKWERDDTERIALALRHAIRLSGGTVSPF